MLLRHKCVHEGHAFLDFVKLVSREDFQKALLHNKPKFKKAIDFATEAHGTQLRRYTDEPYITHPIWVATAIAFVGGTDDMIIGGILHDVVEDTPVTRDQVYATFGSEVGVIIDGLSDASKPTDGNHAKRKAIDRAHTLAQPAYIQVCKLADVLHNTLSIGTYDPKFFKVYKEDKQALLHGLDYASIRATFGGQELLRLAQEALSRADLNMRLLP